MSLPRGALVVATMPGALQVVGGLPLAVRAVLALRAAGVVEVAVLGGSATPRLRAALARRDAGVRWVDGAGDAAGLAELGAVLVLPGDVLVDPEGAARAPRCPGVAVPRLLADLEGGARLAEALSRAGATEPSRGDGLFVPLDAAHPPGALERLLLDHLAGRTAIADSFLAALIDRRLARPLTRLLLPRPVTPSQITLASVLVGLLGAAGLATVSYPARVAGLFALVGSIVLDCVDGEVARARFEQSAAGARLDVIGDYVVHLATFAGLAIGLARQGLPPAGVWALVGLVLGVAAAMATMHALFVRPALRRGGDLHWTGDAESLRGTSVAAVVEKLASRDYTYLLLVLALLGHLEWFLYAAAAGSWAFVAGLLGYWGYRRAAPRGSVAST